MDAGEEESVAILTSMMGDCDPEMVRRVLRKHNGEMQKAATAILEGDTGAEDQWPSNFGSITDVSISVAGPSTPPRECRDALCVVQIPYGAHSF
jgi:hypothetical protein